jgi:hypothetical protein
MITNSYVDKKSKKSKNSKNSKAVYLTHDNYGRPFRVIANHDIKIQKLNCKTHEYEPLITYKKYKGYWKGYDKECPGNTILINLDNKNYVYVGGMSIRKFKPFNKIIDYFSFVGNNDVPYPFAIDKDYIYYVEEDQYAKTKKVTLDNFDKVAIEFYNGLDTMNYQIEEISPRGCGALIDVLDAFDTNILRID